MRKWDARPAALVALLFALDLAVAGDWTKTGPQELRFEGPIQEGEYDRFARVFDASIREIIVNSGGGDTKEGIRIGLAIAGGDVKITVVGKCLSSCANYIFTAGHRREIRAGVVGFHGNVQGCGGGARRAEILADLKKRYDMSEKDLKREGERQDREISEEARFLSIMGVSQKLFDRSCTPDKGTGDKGTYDFLLPTRATFEKYGFWGIVGEQDPAVMKTLTFPYVVD